jgi:hypothetical protein
MSWAGAGEPVLSTEKTTVPEVKGGKGLPVEMHMIMGEKIDWIIGSSSLPESRRNSSRLSIHGDIRVNFNESFRLKTGIGLGMVGYRSDGGEEVVVRRLRFLGDTGLLLDQLQLEYEDRDQFIVMAGKFNPIFGTITDSQNYHGIGGADIADEYSLQEKWGFQVAMLTPLLRLNFSFFRDDNSFLSNSLLANRGQRQKAVGSSGNLLKNFALGGQFALEDAKNHIYFGYRHRYFEAAGYGAENGYLLGNEWLWEETSQSFGCAAAVETAIFTNYNGEVQHTSWFTTLSLPFFYGGWSIGMDAGLKLDYPAGFQWQRKYFSVTGDTLLLQLNIGYTFVSGLRADLSRRYQRNFAVADTHIKNYNSWGFGISYELDLN